MRPNVTKRRLAAGQSAVGLFVSSASPLAAEIVGYMALDWVLIDLQHGENNLANLSVMLQAVSATPATPLVRVPALDSLLIQRTLDLGAYGIVAPMVSTPAEAQAVVRAASYPPAGVRSWGPIRGSLYGGADYFTGAAAETLLIAMLETAEAVANAEAIMATPGIDGCLVGTNDLRIAYGVPPEGGTGEALDGPAEASVETILAACRATGKAAGIQVYSAEAANRRLAQGFRFIGLGTELRLMRGAATALLGAVRRDA
jgi:4-hydroxy-2-oxoheptanedioate aldolase